MGLKSSPGLGPSIGLLYEPPSSHLLRPYWASSSVNRQWHEPAPPGRVIPNSYIPNIRPQVDLNLFTSIFTI